MRARTQLVVLIASFAVALGWSSAQQPPAFTGIQRLTNRETLLQLTASNGLTYRIEAATEIESWYSLLTLQSTGVNRHADSATPYLNARYYRALQVPTNSLTGDHLVTTNGDVVIHPMFHATFVMSWNGIVIYNDPDDDAAYAATYNGLPKADLILVSHNHSDHLSAAKLEAIRHTNTVIIASLGVYNHATMTAALRSNTTVLAYGASTNLFGLTVQAVPGYNGNHPYGTNNSYIVSIGGKRIFITGDVGNTPEMRALSNVDVAFICMNSFTMTVNEATNAVHAVRPAVVYPYHYRNSGNITTNAAYFKQQLRPDLGVEVRLRKWY